jgi:hypothetical protein
MFCVLHFPALLAVGRKERRENNIRQESREMQNINL